MVCDLGLSPISNAFINPASLNLGETFYPLKLCVCQNCWLAQLENSPAAATHFHDAYLYFSSYSASWVAHARRYVDMIIPRLALNAASRVMEIASNDGYLLQHFIHRGIPAVGIEPTAGTAKASREKGIETLEMFFGVRTARALAESAGPCDLVLGNNVLAHVPDLHDFIGGLTHVLKEQGVATFEFPHLLNLLCHNQFDTIYHEHYSYLSLIALDPVIKKAGLRIFDVEILPTHGGSLRIYLCRQTSNHNATPAVEAILQSEQAGGLGDLAGFSALSLNASRVKRTLIKFLMEAQEAGQTVAGYGAAAKGNTLLNYCGIKSDQVRFVADLNPMKQGLYLPGSRIPVVAPEQIERERPDFLLILPWNIKEEVMEQNAFIRKWGGRFVVPIPSLEVLS